MQILNYLNIKIQSLWVKIYLFFNPKIQIKYIHSLRFGGRDFNKRRWYVVDDGGTAGLLCCLRLCRRLLGWRLFMCEIINNPWSLRLRAFYFFGCMCIPFGSHLDTRRQWRRWTRGGENEQKQARTTKNERKKGMRETKSSNCRGILGRKNYWVRSFE